MLEVLPNELLLEIFQFLEPVDLFQAFFGLNDRFNILLTKSQTYHLDFRLVLTYRCHFFIQQYLPRNLDQIISLRFSNYNEDSSSQIDFFFFFDLQFNHFIHLRSLSLCYIQAEDTLRKIMNDCHQLPQLTHLKIIKGHEEYMSSLEFSNNIWSLTKLTHCRLDIEDDFCKPTVTSLTIEYLSITCQCWWLTQTTDLFQQTPNLRRLHIPLNNVNDISKVLLPSVPLITILKLSNVRSLSTMKTILLVVPNLIYLKVDMHHINFDGYLWKEIIDKHLPKLKVFHLRMSIRFLGERNNNQYVNNLVNSFRTGFWIEEHQWYICYHHRFVNGSRSVLLYSLPYTFDDFDSNMITVPYKSTCPEDINHYLYDRVNQVYYDFPLYKLQIFVQFLNIQSLSIQLPLSANFWDIFPTLNHLHSLTILSAKWNAELDLQLLLERSPKLYSLKILSWIPCHISVVHNINTSVRRLDLRMNEQMRGDSFFTRREFNIFTRSLLAMSCEELLINVEDSETVINLVNDMNNLRILHIEYKNSFNATAAYFRNSRYHSSTAARYNHNKELHDKFINDLQDRLPSTCTISKSGYGSDNLKLCINFKKC